MYGNHRFIPEMHEAWKSAGKKPYLGADPRCRFDRSGFDECYGGFVEMCRSRYVHEDPDAVRQVCVAAVKNLMDRDLDGAVESGEECDGTFETYRDFFAEHGPPLRRHTPASVCETIEDLCWHYTVAHPDLVCYWWLAEFEIRLFNEGNHYCYDCDIYHNEAWEAIEMGAEKPEGLCEWCESYLAEAVEETS